MIPNWQERTREDVGPGDGDGSGNGNGERQWRCAVGRLGRETASEDIKNNPDLKYE